MKENVPYKNIFSLKAIFLIPKKTSPKPSKIIPITIRRANSELLDKYALQPIKIKHKEANVFDTRATLKLF